MILSKNNKLKCPLDSYIMETDGQAVFNNVIIRSELHCVAWCDTIEHFAAAREISVEHCGLLLENSYNAAPKDAYFFNDPGVSSVSFDVQAVIDFCDEAGIPNDFEPTDTTVQAIQKLDAMGYYFNRNIKENLVNE